MRYSHRQIQAAHSVGLTFAPSPPFPSTPFPLFPFLSFPSASRLQFQLNGLGNAVSYPASACRRPRSRRRKPPQAAVDLLSHKLPSRTLSRAGLSRFGSKPSPAVKSTAENGLIYSNSLHSKAIFCQFIKIKVVVCQLNHFSAVLGFS